MSTYDPLQTHRRLWNDPENILSESIAGTIMMHPNLVHLENCKAIIRQDYDKVQGKVRIIGGGAVIDGPMYAGFVGPGMLTAAVLGLHGSASSVPSSDSIFEVINHVVKDDKQPVKGVLLLVHDCAEYFLNFLLAKSKAEGKGIPIRMILVRDEVSDKLNQKPSSPRSPSGLLLLYKIAGAMSEEGKSLDEIYDTCDEIIKNGVVFSIGIYIVETISEAAQIEISRGDRLSDRDIKRFSVASLSTKEIIGHIINEFINADNFEKFPRGSKLSLLLDYFGGFSELEVNIIVKELSQQLNQHQLKVEIIYAGAFHTSIEASGFHLSLLNLSSNVQFVHYLNAPTLAYSWPKNTNGHIDLQTNIENKNHTKEETDKNQKIIDNNKIKIDHEKGVSTDVGTFETDILLTAVEFACEALIACATKIDMLDKPLIPEGVDRCGTRLASIADAIKTAVRKKKFVGLDLSNIIFHLALTFEQCVQDPQAELYTLFLNSLGKAIDDQSCLEASDWLDAFVKAINSVDNLTKGTKFSDTLYAAKAAFCDAYAVDDNINVMHALGHAVSAAQKQTSHVIPDSGRIPENLLNDKDCGYSGLAGAHAIGVWMRGAYEGIKLKYSRHRSRDKRVRFNNDFAPDDAEVAAKIPKLQQEASSS